MLGEGCDNGTIILASEDSLVYGGRDAIPASQVHLALIVMAIEVDTEFCVGLVEPSIYPAVHLSPESYDVRVIGLPALEYLLSFLRQGLSGSITAFGFAFRFLFEADVETADEM